MTRQRVPPEKRQRTAHACDSCKRRKQKCDGRQPCETCTRRRYDCIYSNSDGRQNPTSPNESQPSASNVTSSSAASTNDSPVSLPMSLSGSLQGDQFGVPPQALNTVCEDRGEWMGTETDTHAAGSFQRQAQSTGLSMNPPLLESVRMLVQTLAGPDRPTNNIDHWHQIAEQDFAKSSNIDLKNLIPPKATALILIRSYFQNTTGTLEVFGEQEFLKQVHQYYRNIGLMGPAWLCHFYLVLAIGFTLSTPLAGTQEALLVDEFQLQHHNRCEEWYFAARQICGSPHGFESAEFWSVQALTLMSWLMLCRSHRSIAYSHMGAAVRSGHAVGLHRQEWSKSFNPLAPSDGIKTWRSLFILDLFLADCLSRPQAMSASDLLNPILNISPGTNWGADGSPHLCAAAADASMMTHQTISETLQSMHTVSAINAPGLQAIAIKCRAWPQTRATFLSWRNASPRDIRKSTAILHCNLSYCHAITLLSRRLLLQLLSRIIKKGSQDADEAQSQNDKSLSKYPQICVEACAQTIAIVDTAKQGGYLPRMNPVASYHVFNAALVIFVNELVRPGAYPQAHHLMDVSTHLLEYCAEVDPQAKKAMSILTDLSAIIDQERSSARRHVNSHPASHRPEQLHDIHEPVLGHMTVPKPFSFTPESYVGAGLPSYMATPHIGSSNLGNVYGPSNGQSGDLQCPMMGEPYMGQLHPQNTPLTSGPFDTNVYADMKGFDDWEPDNPFAASYPDGSFFP